MYTVSLSYPLSRIVYSAMLCGVLCETMHNSLILTPPLHLRAEAVYKRQ